MTTSTIKKQRKGKNMENKPIQLARNTNTEPEIVAQTHRTFRDEQLHADAQEYNEILRQARRGLTEPSLEAVMVLRREMEYRQILMDLLVDGKIEAEIPNDDGGSLTLDHFRWEIARQEDAA